MTGSAGGETAAGAEAAVEDARCPLRHSQGGIGFASVHSPRLAVRASAICAGGANACKGSSWGESVERRRCDALG
jgi:hypothetical protein